MDKQKKSPLPSANTRKKQPYIQPNPRYRMDITVRNRTGPGLIGTIVEIVAGLAVLVVIAVVLLTGLGAVMVNLNTTGGLPQPVADWSLGFYHYFFK
ncbi:MAG TPA: hypothetical protein VMC84_08545 [Methanocella sp.]|uniref:hypothetical protein n=1 Tax=Methanocella sp. TaxID=2052833 RepID=UPI002CFEEDE1|nr:hypothetical protein [Methanocella sp.]HTY91209.1 hypothetical protein [Methanocella sp.]